RRRRRRSSSYTSAWGSSRPNRSSEGWQAYQPATRLGEPSSKGVPLVLLRRLLLIAALLSVAVSSTAQATAAGTNGRIVFTRAVDNNSELYSANSDGSAERRLTWTFFDGEQSPDWSPDGARIVFTRFGTGRA